MLVYAFSIIILALSISIFFDKHLSADGAHYFALILETHTFTYIDWTRQYANYFSQLLLVIAVNSGINDIDILRTIFGMSVLLPYILVFLFSLFALRGEDKSVILFVLISMITINLTSDFILVGEHQALALLSWPILFFLLRRTLLTWWDALFLFGLMFLYTRLYATALVPAVFFIVIAFWRMRNTLLIPQKVYYFVAFVFATIAAIISAYAILYPRSPGNKAGFSQVILQSICIPEVITSFIFLILFFCGWFFKRRILIWAAMIPVVIFIGYVISTKYVITAEQSFGNRSLVLTLLPFLLFMAIALHHKQVKADVTVYVAFMVFISIMAYDNFLSTVQWNHFRHQMLSVLHTRHGFVRMEDTPMNISPYKWSWTNSELSAIWSGGCVRTIVLNAENIGWEPGGPPQTFILKSYICYRDEFLMFDSSLCKCH